MKKVLTIILGLVVGVIGIASTEIKSESTREELSREIKNELKTIEIKLYSKPTISDEKESRSLESNENTEKDEMAQYTYYQTGMASYYGGKWHGKRTANGEIFDTYKLTAAHKTLPFNTRVRVTNLSNGKSVIVRINNRGPYVKGRVIDLSQAAFSAIANMSKGVTKVKLEIVK